MEMSIATEWGKEGGKRGCFTGRRSCMTVESLSRQEGTRKSTRLHPGDGQGMVYMVMELALLWFFCDGYFCI